MGGALIRLALRPRDGKWPFSGYFGGHRSRVSWVGCVGDGTDPTRDWREACRFRRRLSELSDLSGDKKGAIATFFSIMGKERGCGLGEDELSVLVAAWDPSGVAISGFGLHAIVGMQHPGAADIWLEGEHPLLSLPGWPETSMGAMVMPEVPEWLVGVLDPSDDGWRGRLSGDVLTRSGVEQ